ncbi:DUF402 domain-containing protein [Staphylospora marina]|uniref:DUF402 domain-containing protein n=1 Tax=Staphylospora marina TaxID=2490858 RepID=UPI0013DE5FB6|nr:DUF402 domain-containing protein [Staphylospora marina]
MNLKQGDTIRIESFKHGGTFHRAWKESVILRPEDPLILANHDAEVIEKDGRERIFPGLAVCHFSRRDWFHTVVLFDGEYRLKQYYCNIASPFWLEGKTLRYVDYDLDLVAEPDLTFRWLDEDEFSANRILYGYPDDLVRRIHDARNRLEERIRGREEPFGPGFAPFWCKRWFEWTNRKGKME